MIDTIKKYQFSPDELPLEKEEIYRTMGYDILPPKQITDDVESFMTKSHEYMAVECGYSLIIKENLEVRNRSFFINGEKFNCGAIIYNQIKKAEMMMVFLATLGNEFDEYSKSWFENGDPYKGYLIDAIGSVTVESAIDKMCEEIEPELAQAGLHCTNRFSPGYCNWDIKEQQKLFAQLPENFLPVKLLPSSLMLPIKSVSGIIGIGQNLRKMDYPCAICNQEHCIMRRQRYKSKEKV